MIPRLTHCFLLLPLMLPADWTHRTAHNFALPLPESTRLTSEVNLVRPLWELPIHTGIGKAGSGAALEVLRQGFSPTFGETAAAVVAEGVYLLSWSEATGEVIARPESITDRYFRGEENFAALSETHFRIDANWNTIAVDAATGEVLWQASEPSASLHFLTSKRGHNGIDPAAGQGIYVTVSIAGRIFAYDLRTGEKRWEATVGAWHERAEAFKAEALAERRLPGVSDGMFGFVRPGLVTVDDLAVVPDLQGGLLGFRLDDGAQQWHIPEPVLNRQGAPRLWQHEGRSYLLTHQNQGGNTVSLIDPREGRIVWQAPTGYNPGDLIVGGDVVMLNPDGNRRNPALLAAYRIGIGGLERRWRFADEDQNRVPVRADRGAERKGVIDAGRLYLALGQPNAERHVAVVDVESGEVLFRETDRRLASTAGLPVSLGNMLYWQVDSSHSGPSGLFLYEKQDDDSLIFQGEVNYRSLGVDLLTDYEYPSEMPFAGGVLFLRGKRNLMAVDLRTPARAPFTLKLEGAWAGFHRPVEAVWVVNDAGQVVQGRLEVPPRGELGVPGTTARRVDVWDQLVLDEPRPAGQAWTAEATLHMASFDWTATLEMAAAEGGEWRGRWIRSFPGWETPLQLSGTLMAGSEGGHPRRAWPTGWLEHQPVTFFSDLPEGGRRVFLQLGNALQREDGAFRNLTLCLDIVGDRVISAVAGAFAFNQSYHEVETSELTVTEDGISGSARMVLNPDRWMRATDWKNGGSLLGRLTLDVRFGEAEANGIYPVTGDWVIEWGVSGELSGEIRAAIPAP